MLEVACKDIEDNTDLNDTFVKCIQDAGVVKSAAVISLLHNQISRKLFHARVNEYMRALIELELERSGKAVMADQSLCDHLKTFSAMKTRSS